MATVMSTVVALPRPTGDVILTKRQLGEHLGRSPRWIELRVREGMPVEEGNDRYGRRRFNLTAVEAWLREGKPKPPASKPDLEQRVASLEQQLSELLRRFDT